MLLKSLKFVPSAVERRRRDKINNWIVTLSKLIPDCSVDSRSAAVSSDLCARVHRRCPLMCWLKLLSRFSALQSKGGILSKACDYIRELRQNNQRLQESCKEVEQAEMDNELLRQQVHSPFSPVFGCSFHDNGN